MELSAAIIGGKSVMIRANVIDSIAAECPYQDLEAIKKMSFIQGLPLADPEMGLSGRLDLLLGVSDCNRCAEDGQIYSPDRHLCAQNTIFGWSLGGSVEGGKTSDISHLLTRRLTRFFNASG